MGRAPCCDKANVKKGPWSPEEDAKLKSYIEQHGTGGNWIALPQKIGLRRCGKSCRLRWLNYLRPNIKHGGFSEEEDNIIYRLFISIGSRWSIIASQLPGRTDNDVKNYWNTKLKKKLFGKQRKEPQLKEPKQEVNKEGEHNGSLGMISTGDGAYRITGWSQQPALMYPIDHLNHHHRIGDEQELKPLVELEGRFCTGGAIHGSSFVVPSTFPQHQQQIYDDPCISSASPSNSLQENNGFSTELDEILRFNPVKREGTDCSFYGIGGLVEESNTATKLGNMNWNEEVSPLMYPNMMKGYQGMQQLLFEEQVHFGI